MMVFLKYIFKLWVILVPRSLKEMHETQKDDDGKRSYEINPQLKVVYQILTSTQLILFNWVGPALIGMTY